MRGIPWWANVVSYHLAFLFVAAWLGDLWSYTYVVLFGITLAWCCLWLAAFVLAPFLVPKEETDGRPTGD